MSVYVIPIDIAIAFVVGIPLAGHGVEKITVRQPQPQRLRVIVIRVADVEPVEGHRIRPLSARLQYWLCASDSE